MQGSIPRARRTLIRRIAAMAAAPDAPPPRDLLLALAPRWLHGVAEDEIAARPAAAWLAMLASHLRFGRDRRRGRDLVRVFNPEEQRDGFDSAHTLVQVVTEDRPFLVDSATMAIAAAGDSLHLVVHPVLLARRDTRGRLRGFTDPPARDATARAESWQFYEIDRIADPARRADLERRLRRSLADVRAATTDWRALTARALAAAAQVETTAPRTPAADAREAAALLRWMVDDHFTFLGYREYRVRLAGRRRTLVPLPETGLGLLRAGLHGGPPPAPMPLTGAVLRFARSPAPLLIGKGNDVSTVHRATYHDYVGIKIFDSRGGTTGEHRFIGLWTSSAYHTSPRAIPVLRRRVADLLARLRLDPAGHDGKAVLNVVETYPRDELFQTPPAALAATVRGIVNLYERARTRLFLRRDPFGRFCSCLLYLPRDRYDTDVRRRVEELIRQSLNGLQVESQVQLSESTLARLHVLVRTDPARPSLIGAARLERLVAEATRSWHDDLRRALLVRHGEDIALALLDRCAPLFPPAYRADVPVSEAVADIAVLQGLRRDAVIPGLRIVCRAGEPRDRLSFRLFRHGTAVPVADVMPTLENLGFRLVSERPWALGRDADVVWVQDFEVECTAAPRIDPARDAGRLIAAFEAVWRGDADNDGFNRLVVAADLDWRGATVLRAYARWLAQLGLPFSQKYLEDTLVRHRGAARALYGMFAARFDPACAERRRGPLARRQHTSFQRHLAAVTRQDEDRILRALLHAVEATVRTSHFQRDAAGAPLPWLALKIETGRVPEAPRPRPLCEIFVHSPRVEAVHLRMGRVARGGLRWSDRREDFRTEVLGLMKAQHVKNTLIVPVGAKGGFVPRRPPAGRDQQRDGIECYRLFIRALLGLTDDLVDGRVVPPADVVRLDGDDPYLVVAADKGTAAFSDLANAIALERNYWLGDAFASGGSAGYDHKRMGITARGAWECVGRHFRELGLDPRRQDFTVAGIGDMSGDVFGNGMLWSRHIRLVAAFDHRHILIDPEPDAALSFVERRRLFRLPRSSWDDYDRRLISRGGGVFERQAKSLSLAPEARRLLGLDASSATPQEVIRCILCLPVDLLWNGGIGTYVKSSQESHADIGDRVNDAVRVDGARLRARVVVEGGNLGFSQAARIEYARHGGRINADFVDNSGGVNCSDLEVNIKIALNGAMAAGRLSRRARDGLLARMTGDVTALVLRNNYLQGQALSVLQAGATERAGGLAELIGLLERSIGLDRRLENLPGEEELAERRRQGAGFTRPELAMLQSWARIWLDERLLQSDVPEDPYLGRELERCFPAPMRRRFAPWIAGHRLRREIIATATTNGLVNRMGPAFVPRMAEETGAGVGAVVRAWTIAREITGMRPVWHAIESLDHRLPATRQYTMMHETARLLAHLTGWILEHRGGALDIERNVGELAPGMRRFLALAPRLLTGAEAEVRATRESALRAEGVPAGLAAGTATLPLARPGLDVVDLARRARVGLAHAAHVHLQLGAATGLDWLRHQADALPVEGHFQSMARASLREQAHALQRQLCELVLSGSHGMRPAAAVARWRRRHGAALEALARSRSAMRTTAIDFPTLSVALAAVRRLTAP